VRDGVIAATAVAKQLKKKKILRTPIGQAPSTFMATPAKSMPTARNARLMHPANSGCGNSRFVFLSQ
jgi:hypothetical protein